MGQDGSLVFGSYDRSIYKLDKNGALVWKVKTGGAVYGGVSLDKNGVSYVGSFDDKLYAIDEDGKTLWSTDIGAHGDSGWAIGEDGTDGEGLVFGQSNEGGYCTSFPPPDVPVAPNRSPGGSYCYAMAVNKTTGNILWKVWTGSPGGGGMIADNLFITGSWNQYVVAYEALTGKVRWYFNAGGAIESHPAISPPGNDDAKQRSVFVSAEDPSKTLWSIDLQTGKALWNYTGAGEELNSSPSVTRDMVYVGSNDHYLHGVDIHTGEFKFKFKTCANVFSSPAVDLQGMVYVGCNTVTGTKASKGVGAMYAINPKAEVEQSPAAAAYPLEAAYT